MPLNVEQSNIIPLDDCLFSQSKTIFLHETLNFFKANASLLIKSLLYKAELTPCNLHETKAKLNKWELVGWSNQK